MKRCIVCNGESYGFDFCSTDCQLNYNNLMDEIDDNLNQDDEEPPYLDDYYSPYKREWLGD